MDRISLFEEYRLIERDESEVNGAWKGAHLLLFFMAFVFGSFCTFCFHMLMYLFDEKCVLFPKLQSLTSVKHNVIYEFIPVDKETFDQLPVDFLSSQWIEKSACYLPTYVPLLSGIFGLVWTTMFLMCSTGTRTQTGFCAYFILILTFGLLYRSRDHSLQRPWRVLPPVFVFSLVMGALCIYSSSVTHYGLNELCVKLGEITGSSTCSYTVNVATLAYERRIRGVYQAIRLTIISAWLHTMCWLLSAVLAMVRVALAVDFQLVRINVTLIGNVDKMLEHQETQIRTVSPDMWCNEDDGSQTSLSVPVPLVHFTNANTHATVDDIEELYNTGILYLSQATEHKSELSLVSSESHRLAYRTAKEKYSKKLQFIVEIVYDLLLAVYASQNIESLASLAESSLESVLSESVIGITRQYGKEKLNQEYLSEENSKSQSENLDDTESAAQNIRQYLEERLQDQLFEYSKNVSAEDPSTFNLYKEMKSILDAKLTPFLSASGEHFEEKTIKKSNLKNVSVQTDKKKQPAAKVRSQKVQITEPDNTDDTTETAHDTDKETQTSKEKEKQD